MGGFQKLLPQVAQNEYFRIFWTIRDPSIYLLPERDLESELEECFKKACVEIFEDQLNGWYREEEMWPEDRSLGVCQLWFDSILYDLEDEPLVAEDL